MSESMAAYTWLDGRAWGWVAASFALGCFSAGYYYVRWRTGQDLRQLGSGSTGARNAGRVTGRTGFAVSLLGDAAKGALAVAGARALLLDPVMVACSMLAVVAGHIWPVQLGFRGGKGIGPTLGALAVYDPLILLWLVVLLIPARTLLGRLVPAGLLALALTPAALLLTGFEPLDALAVALLAMLALWSHRGNLRREWSLLAERFRLPRHDDRAAQSEVPP